MTHPDLYHDFRTLVQTHQERIRSVCYRFVNNSDDADDLAQDVFIQVFESLRHFRNESELSTWIYRIAVNKSLDFLRKRKRKKHLAWLLPIHNDSGTEALSQPSEGNPYQQLEAGERRHILNRAVGRLPENQRTAIVLSKYEQLPNKEIAAVMDVSVPAVDALIHRAKKNLYKELRRYFQERW